MKNLTLKRLIINPYWTSSSFKIKRSKTKDGKGEVVYKTGGVINKRVEGDGIWRANRYSYPGVYINDKYIVLGEFDATTEVITYKKINIKSKKEKEFSSHVIPYYHPGSGSYFDGSLMWGVYKDELYHQKISYSYGQYKSVNYRTNMKTGKSVKIKGKNDIIGHTSLECNTFDGRYFYQRGSSKAYDCKTNKLVKNSIGKKMDYFELGQGEKLYAIRLTTGNHMVLIVGSSKK